MLSYCKTEAAAETNSTQNPGGILNKSQVVKHPYYPFLNVPSPPEKVPYLPESVRIQAYRQGVDGEISAVKIPLDETGLHCWESPRTRIVLVASCRYVNFKTIGKGPLRPVPNLSWLRTLQPGNSDARSRANGMPSPSITKSISRFRCLKSMSLTAPPTKKTSSPLCQPLLRPA